MNALPHVLAALSDAYLQVGVWVAVMIWLCAWLRERPNGRFSRLLAHPSFAPWIGAALGVTPGCGGAVVVMPLFVSGKTTFGAVVATLVATMGDSSFVMLAARPGLGLLIHAGLFGLGGLCGSVVDMLAWGKTTKDRQSFEYAAPARRFSNQSSVGAVQLVSDLMFRSVFRPALGPILLFWIPAMVGLVLAIAISFFRVEAEIFGASEGIPNLHLFGAFGAMQFIVLAILGWSQPRSKRRVYDTNSRGLAVESLHESAPVVFWVALSFLLTALLVEGLGIDLSFLRVNSLWAVCMGACVGLIPGCGPQIVLTGLYLDGVVGLPVLLANAVSQDGDALLPLLAQNPKAAAFATVLTTIPALAVGAIAWTWLGTG